MATSNYKLIIGDCYNPFYNLAAEEYFIKQYQQEVIFIYQNSDAVIVGKNQNALAEVNRSFVKAAGIPVVRRISGGGTVFHDMGNINYAFFSRAKKGQMIDYEPYLKVIRDFFAMFNLCPHVMGANSLGIEGKKFSGNAQYAHKQLVLHHGTLLFDSDLDKLSEAIKVKGDRYQDKAVDSIRSATVNLSSYIDLTREQFLAAFIAFIKNHFGIEENTRLGRVDHEKIQMLADEKFTSWQWNWGHSPSYTLQSTLIYKAREAIIRLEVRRGVIEKAWVDGVKDTTLNEAIHNLVGYLHEEEEVAKAIAPMLDMDTADQLITELF